MSALLIISVIAGYFGVLILISQLTKGKADSKAFYLGDKKSPWFLVAFGMIGASLSGVTFISVPGEVGFRGFAYFQAVLGYIIGYLVIAFVLLPIYYKMQLTSIYTYLKTRFGEVTYKTGAGYFLISRVIGASFRLFLVAIVFEYIFKDLLGYNVPFSVIVLVTIILIWVYTFRGGIKTIVWTDSLQTFFMLFSIGLTFFLMAKGMNWSIGDVFTNVVNSVNLDSNSIYYSNATDTNLSKIFVWDSKSWLFFPKHFFGGAFIAIAMTGLDQDMMQKNLSCKTLKDSQKNMMWFTGILVLVNLVVLFLGALFVFYAEHIGLALPTEIADADLIFAQLALNGNLSVLVGITFLIGLIAAAYSSADSALTALTTSFCIDILGFKEDDDSANTKRNRMLVHIGFSILLFIVIILFKGLKNDTLITQLFIIATFTYGPLVGLYAFGIFSKRKLNDLLTPIICIAVPIICYFLKYHTSELFNGYQFGYELLIINGALTFLGLLLISTPSIKET